MDTRNLEDELSRICVEGSANTDKRRHCKVVQRSHGSRYVDKSFQEAQWHISNKYMDDSLSVFNVLIIAQLDLLATQREQANLDESIVMAKQALANLRKRTAEALVDFTKASYHKGNSRKKKR